MPVADLPHPLEVARGRREAAAGVLHRLEEDGGHGVRALEEDLLLDLVGRPPAEGLGVVAEHRRPVDVGVGHPERAGDQRLEDLLERRDPGDGQRPLRGAVVGDRPADDLGLHRLADQLEVLLGRLPRRLHGLAAAGGEEDPVQVAGSGRGQPLGQLDRRRVGVGPQREEGQLLGLARGGLGQHAAPVPGLDDEQPGQPVEVAPAAVVVDPRTLAADDHRRGLSRRRRPCARSAATGSRWRRRRPARW